MKSIITILMLIMLSIPSVIAQTTHENADNTQKSLIQGLESPNLGLKTSCAYMLGELRVTESIIPLMKLLRSNECEEVRISAALALYKIGTPMSIYAVKQASVYDVSERVVKLTSSFYNEYLRNKIRVDEISTDNTNVAIK